MFPTSLTGVCDEINWETINKRFDISKSFTSNLFKLPVLNELDKIATDSSGKLKKLDDDQLKQIKKSGYFH